MRWNDIASEVYSTEPSPGHCVLHYSPTLVCHRTVKSASLFSLTLLIYIQTHSKWLKDTMYVCTINNGWTIQAPDNRHDRSTNGDREGGRQQRRAEYRTCCRVKPGVVG